MNELGLPDSVHIYNEATQEDTVVIPNVLSMEQFTHYWKPSWAKALVKYHPEYCNYEYCVSISSSHDYDEAMLMIDNYDTAVARGFLNPLNHSTAECGFDTNTVNMDPFSRLPMDCLRAVE